MKFILPLTGCYLQKDESTNFFENTYFKIDVFVKIVDAQNF